MNKKIFVTILTLVFACMTIFSSVASADAGGLLRGKGIQPASSFINPIGSVTYAITDGNAATTYLLKTGIENANVVDYLYYTFPSAVSINAFKLQIANYSNQTIYMQLLNANDQPIFTLNNKTYPYDDGVYYLPQTYSGVKKVVLRYASPDVRVAEWDLYNIKAPVLTATGAEVGISLNWDKVEGAETYTIYRSLTSGGPFTEIAESTTENFVDRDVSGGVTYYYYISPKNSMGYGANSNEASATPPENDPDSPEAPMNLEAAPNNEDQIIQLSWDTVTGATYYNVYRATNPGGPYEKIAVSSNNSYADSNVTTGLVYYYVVTANDNEGESVNSNEASAILQTNGGHDPEETTGRALLTIYISGGQIKEYDLSATELSTFLNWYDAKDAGSGPAKYAFAKTWNKGPFKTRTEYVIFDKILTFDVDEYEVENP